MRTTKQQYVCLARTATYGGYDPKTGAQGGPGPNNTQVTVRQEMWVKGYIRTDKEGREYEYKFQDATTIYSALQNTYGLLYLKELPYWEDIGFTDAFPESMTNPDTGKAYPAQVNGLTFVYFKQPEVNLASRVTSSNYAAQYEWLRIKSINDTGVGSRFNKHYECAIGTEGDSVNRIKITRPPETLSPDAVVRLEGAEMQLRFALDALDNVKE